MYRLFHKYMLNLTLKIKYNIMKNLLVLLVIAGTLMFSSCDNNPVGISASQKDNVSQSVRTLTVPTVCVTTQSESTIYEYDKIFSDGVMLNITFPDCNGGNCGISIELNSIIYYETFK